MDRRSPGHGVQNGRSGGMPVRLPEALGQSDAFLSFRERLSRVAPIERPVLLLGERGTGKELAAARLHYLSGRWQGAFVALNCSALSSSLIESELFGYEKGAFTGADQRRTGRFEAADGGTLFLDEIGSIPMEVQEKILRVVEYGVFERVGSPEAVEADVRIIGATNTDLPVLAAEGRFKRDLLDRLSFEVLVLPPLRDRREDILFLADHFAARMAYELGRDDMPHFSGEAGAALEAHPWPGNIRELKNAVERAVYRADTPRIEEVVFDPFPAGPGTGGTPTGASRSEAAPCGGTEDLWTAPLREAVRSLEIRRLRRALEEARYNQKKAARALGLTYHQFRGLFRKHREAVGP